MIWGRMCFFGAFPQYEKDEWWYVSMLVEESDQNVDNINMYGMSSIFVSDLTRSCKARMATLRGNVVLPKKLSFKKNFF